MKLGTKLLLAPLLTGVIALIGGGVNAVLMDHAAAGAATSFRTDLDTLRTITQVQAQVGQLHAGAYRMVALIGSLDEAAVKAYRADLRSQLEAVGRVITAAAGPPDQATAWQASVAGIVTDLDKYGKQADNAVDMASVDSNTGIAAMQGADTTFKAVSKAMATIVSGVEAAAADASRASAASARRTTWLLTVASVLATVVTLGLCLVMLRKVTTALRRAADVAEAVAQGNLATPAASERDDEIGDLQRALARMVAQLRDSIQTVQDAAQRIAGAGSQIATGNLDLSHRTEQTASNLQQAAASLEELTGNVQHSSASAAQASTMAASAAAVAVRGGTAVGQVVHTMDEINTSSKRIADIIGTIDGIAFQTNILALNAAVEAARAGEQGRGFAVVASEVRSLAQRSANAAREIKTLISTSVDKVEIGTRQVRDAGTTMDEIVTSVQRVADIIGEITLAAGEQSSGIGQVNGAVNNLDHMTQQNAALVEQSAAAAEHLSDQAQALTGIVARFRIEST
jgi:methyl-accepting chemotaxis protein